MSLPPIRIYDTLSGRKEELTAPDGKIKFFVCGPTVYDRAHLGHAKTYIQFDFIVKYLRTRGWDVFYLQNITDIDDKIIARAREEGISWRDLARRQEELYLEDMRALGVDAVDRHARATDFLPEIISQVERLLEKGVAYRAEDGIYFEVAKFPDYGALSGRTGPAAESALSRIDTGRGKRNEADFCLWKFPKAGDPCWPAPFGKGRPGWHIEDTAITEKFFGPTYDIHGGAADLIFPHHEAEIAQMRAISGKSSFVRYWLHTGFLNIDSRKMSKSLGNFTTVAEALERYPARIWRLLFLTSHYRSEVDFSPAAVEQAKNLAEKIDEFVFRLDESIDDRHSEELLSETSERLHEALADDFAVPEAWAVLAEAFKSQNRLGPPGRRWKRFLRDLDRFWGVFFAAEAASDICREEVQKLLDEREECRRRGDFARADEIRDRLTARGVKIYDTPEGVKYRLREDKNDV